MNAPARPNAGTPLFLIACFSFIAIGAMTGILNIAWTYMQGTYSVSFDSLGAVLSAVTMGRLSMAFISGRLINSFGIGRFLVAGSIVAGVGVMGYALAPSFPLLLVAAFVAAIDRKSVV